MQIFLSAPEDHTSESDLCARFIFELSALIHNSHCPALFPMRWEEHDLDVRGHVEYQSLYQREVVDSEMHLILLSTSCPAHVLREVAVSLEAVEQQPAREVLLMVLGEDEAEADEMASQFHAQLGSAMKHLQLARCQNDEEIISELLRFVLSYLQRAHGLSQDAAALAENQLTSRWYNEEDLHEPTVAQYELIRDRFLALSHEDADAYLPDAAWCEEYVGEIYAMEGNTAAAELAYLRARELYESLASQRSSTFLPMLSNVFNNLANLYSEMDRYDEAERHYLTASKINEDLVSQNADEYLPDYAMTQNNLGLLYHAVQYYDEAVQSFQRSHEIYKLLAQRDELYLADQAEVVYNLGDLSEDREDAAQAEGYFLQCCALRERLLEMEREEWLEPLADAFYRLGNLYVLAEQYEHAEGCYMRSRELFDESIESNEEDEDDLVGLASLLNNLGRLYHLTDRYSEAEDAYLLCREIRTQLAEADPETYELDLAIALFNLGLLYEAAQLPNEALEAWESSLHHYRRLELQQPGSYGDDIASLSEWIAQLRGS